MVASAGEMLHTEDEAADISATGVLLTLDTKDRPHVSATLYHADGTASYLVECSDTDSGTDDDWHTLSDQDTTQSFRFQGTVPERFVRVRVDGAGAADETADLSIQAAP